MERSEIKVGMVVLVLNGKKKDEVGLVTEIRHSKVDVLFESGEICYIKCDNIKRRKIA